MSRAALAVLLVLCIAVLAGALLGGTWIVGSMLAHLLDGVAEG